MGLLIRSAVIQTAKTQNSIIHVLLIIKVIHTIITTFFIWLISFLIKEQRKIRRTVSR